MPNMSYCRFQNTVRDLDDCLENLHNDLSLEEHIARQEIIALAKQIVAQSEDWMDESHPNKDDEPEGNEEDEG